jgi:hypothetical protein
MLKKILYKAKNYLRGTQVDQPIYIENCRENFDEAKYSIGITTFEKRFENFFKPLITEIKSEKKDVEIIVMINCGYNERINEKYKKELLEFISNFDNIFPHVCSEFRALSKLWNNELIFSSNNGVFVCNDDISIGKDFWNDFEYAIKVNEGSSFTINKTWSHVYLNRQEISQVGWFDERLLGVGEEDGDMQFRWEKHFKKKFPNFYIKNISNYVDQSNDQNIKKHSNSKYSKFNRTFILEKYKEDKQNGEAIGMFANPVIKIIKDENQYPYEQFFWENKDKM